MYTLTHFFVSTPSSAGATFFPTPNSDVDVLGHGPLMFSFALVLAGGARALDLVAIFATAFILSDDSGLRLLAVWKRYVDWRCEGILGSGD